MTIDELHVDAANPRKASEEALAGLAQSIDTFGDIGGITFNLTTGELVTGHQRVSQIRSQYGSAKIEPLTSEHGVIKTPRGDFAVRFVQWTRARQRAANVAANSERISGAFDDTLAAYLLDVQDEIRSEMPTVMDDLYLAEYLAEDKRDEIADVEPQLDRAEELATQWKTSAGQLWIIEGQESHRLLCGDSTNAADVERLMDGASVGLCFTSPPYLQQRDYTKEGKVSDWDGLMRGVFSRLPMKENGQILVNLGLVHRDNEWIEYWREWIEWMREQGWRSFGWYVWDQGFGLPGNWNGRYGPCFEFVFHFNRISVQPQKWIDKRPGNVKARSAGESTMRGKDGTLRNFSSPEASAQPHKIPDAVIRVNRQVGSDGHPAQFPVSLPAYVIQSWPSEVYDPFLGSGTTMLAAERLGQRCYGLEISPQYCAVILQRMSDAGCKCRLARPASPSKSSSKTKKNGAPKRVRRAAAL